MNQSNAEKPFLLRIKLIFSGMIFVNFVYLFVIYFIEKNGVEIENRISSTKIGMYFEENFIVVNLFFLALLTIIAFASFRLLRKLIKKETLGKYIVALSMFNLISIIGLLISLFFGFHNVLILYFLAPSLFIFKNLPDFEQL